MDALENLKKRNEAHSKIVNKEKREIMPVIINAVFVMVLLYYELLKNIDSINSINSIIFSETFGTLAFIFVVYNFSVYAFCSGVAKNHILKNLLLIVFHSIFIYLWIWHSDKWSVAYLIGFLLIVLRLFLGCKYMLAKGSK